MSLNFRLLGELMEFLNTIAIIALVIIIILIVAAVIRKSDMSYRFGKGMFESSDYNLDEKDDVSDKEYYDGGGGLLK